MSNEAEKRYIVEREFEHVGYKCVVIFGNMAHRCGYVGIPKNHTLYGKNYDYHLEIKKSDIWGREVSGIFPLLGACIDKDERIRIEAYFPSVTEVFHIQVVEQIQIILSKVIYGGLGSIAVTLEIRRIWIMQYRNSQAVKKFIRCKK